MKIIVLKSAQSILVVTESGGFNYCSVVSAM